MKVGGFVCRCAAVFVLLCSCVLLAQAGVVKLKSSPLSPLLLPPLSSQERQPCEKVTQPTVRAALFGIGQYPSFESTQQLSNAENEVHLLGTALRNLGVKEVEEVFGKVEKDAFTERLQSVAERSNCGDTLVLYYGGHSILRDDSPVLIFSDATKFYRKDEYIPFDFMPGDPPRRHMWVPGMLDSAELLAYFSWLRNHGVNVFFILDAMQSQKLAGKMTVDNEVGSNLWRPFEPSWNGSSTPNAGAFYGIYLDAAYLMRLPKGVPNPKDYSVLSYSLATTLLASHEAESFRAITTSTSQKFKELGLERQSGFTCEASHPNRSPLAVGLPDSGRGEVKLRGREDRRIDITNPAAQRGAARVSGETLLIEGKVVASTVPTSISANETAGRINPDGSFSVSLPIHQGENKVALVAWFGESDFLPKPFTVVSGEGNQVMQEGKNYALIIANQDYKDPAYGKLDTPIGDASALSERLEQKFGFKSKVQIGEQTISLILNNATKVEMERALSKLRKVITPADSVLVFYAGHGIYEKETDQAYWLPVDAEAGEPETWLSAHDVQTAIQRLDARHVLVVADSCFSGGFRKRGTEAEDKSPRLQRLTNSMTRASREFISSGDIEPVADGGGHGHSMFARALLDALDQENKPFTAGEMFQLHVKEAVSGKSGQSPQYFPMKEGHDGGEFVFLPVAVDTTSKVIH
jgi:hypothetical protein